MTPSQYAANIARRFPDLRTFAALAARESERARHVWGRFGQSAGPFKAEAAEVVERRRVHWIAALSRFDHPVDAEALAQAWGCSHDAARTRANSLAETGRIRRYEGKPVKWGVLT